MLLKYEKKVKITNKINNFCIRDLKKVFFSTGGLETVAVRVSEKIEREMFDSIMKKSKKVKKKKGKKKKKVKYNSFQSFYINIP
jgi:hypothetical protein